MYYIICKLLCLNLGLNKQLYGVQCPLFDQYFVSVIITKITYVLDSGSRCPGCVYRAPAYDGAAHQAPWRDTHKQQQISPGTDEEIVSNM